MQPLTEDEIESLEKQMLVQIPDEFRRPIHSSLPKDLKEFYCDANGFSALLSSFSLYGNRTAGHLHGPVDRVGMNIETAVRNVRLERTNEIGHLMISKACGAFFSFQVDLCVCGGAGLTAHPSGPRNRSDLVISESF